jgi:CDP-glucose 4,6-dehydratase
MPEHHSSNLQSFYTSKRVFITGHTGFKGSWLSIWLTSMGADVTGYALEPPTNPSLFKLSGIEHSINSIIADVRDIKKLTSEIKKAKPEIVIHMAAQPLVRDSYKIPVETYETNVMGTVNLLEAVRTCESVKAVINITTDKCYENKEWIWGYRENEPLGGYDPYSNSKACSELVTSSYRNSFFNSEKYGKTHNVALASARAGNVIGGGDFATDRLIPDIIKSFLNKEKVLIRNPYSIRPWQHVLEPLNGYLMLAKELFEKGIDFAEAWNFGPEDSDARPVENIVRDMCHLWGNGQSYEIDKGNHLHEANYLKIDCSKASSKLGWHPKWNLDTTLEKIIEWTKEYKTGNDLYSICLKQIKDYNIK